jgi:hypothetical protein
MEVRPMERVSPSERDRHELEAVVAGDAGEPFIRGK